MIRKLLLPTSAAVAAALLLAAGAWSAGSPQRAKRDDKPPAEYTKGVEYVEAGDFEAARRELERAARKAPRDPDVLNMLAYSQRKSGQLDRAIVTYKKALKVRPRFPQAREYLAEAYLQAALRELDTLEGYGDEGRAERDQVIRALEQAAAREAWGESGGATPKKSW